MSDECETSADCIQGAEAAIIVQVLVGLNRRDPNVFDMHRIDLASGEVTLDTGNPGMPQFRCSTHDFEA